MNMMCYEDIDNIEKIYQELKKRNVKDNNIELVIYKSKQKSKYVIEINPITPPDAISKVCYISLINAEKHTANNEDLFEIAKLVKYAVKLFFKKNYNLFVGIEVENVKFITNKIKDEVNIIEYYMYNKK